MAELARLRLEQTLPELEEMQRIGLFDKNEIKAIVKKRMALEYKLHRNRKVKEHYLKCIEYEMSLLSLIAKRRERLMIDAKKTEVDFAIAKRINRQFKNVLQRYPDDKKIWLDQIQFCKKMKFFSTINSLHTRMLQVHSKSSSLWVNAAKWELEEMNSPENARKLFQRGITLNPKSKVLWHEYFRMELMYTDMIRKRREVLQVQNVVKSEVDSEEDAVYNAEIAKVVYDSAVEEFQDVQFSLQFIQICLEFEFCGVVTDHILENLIKHHPYNEDILDALAKQPLLRVHERIKEGKQVGLSKRTVLQQINNEICMKYEAAIKKVPTEKMWCLYVDFLISLVDSSKSTRKENLITQLMNTFERASSKTCLSANHFCIWFDLLIKRDDTKRALSLALEGAKLHNCADLWQKSLIQLIQSRKMPDDEIFNLLVNAVNSVEEKESMGLWKFGIQWLSIANPELLINFFEVGITKCEEISNPLKAMYLEMTGSRHGVEEARKMFQRFKKIGSLPLPIIRKMIQIEKGQFKSSITELRKYYEYAIEEFGSSNVDVWLDYMKLEIEHTDGDLKAYNMLLWKAKKTLNAEHVTNFLERTMNVKSQ